MDSRVNRNTAAEHGVRLPGWARCPALLACAVVILAGRLATGAEPDVAVSDATLAADGIRRHSVRSPYQAGTTSVRVLLPDDVQPGMRYPLLLVLPVEAEEEHRFGGGLAEVRRLGLHNKHKLVAVAPTFSHLPWYGDHPTDPTIRQETYLLEVVLPLVRERYPLQPGPESCLLLGFSKSGWGVYSLLLRHPDRFGRAAAWDAPLEMTEPGKYGSKIVFTPESFPDYQISKLLERRAENLRGGPARLGLFGYGNFHAEHIAAHERMVRLGIPHEYHDGPQRKHIWESGWIPEAVEFLVGSNDPRR